MGAQKHLRPPPTTMILGDIVIWVYVGVGEMGNGYDILEVEGKREAGGMWLGFVPPI